MNALEAHAARLGAKKKVEEAFLSLHGLVESLAEVEKGLKEAKAAMRGVSLSAHGKAADSTFDFAVSTALRETQASLFQAKAALDSLRVGGI